MKKSPLLLTLFILLFSAQIQPASAGTILEFFFPSLAPKKANPSKTLEAPFADKEQIKNSATKDENVDNTIPLDLPHRSPEQIQQWVMQHAGDHLTFTSARAFQTDLAKIKPYFTDHAWTQYNQFLQTANITKIMTDGRYSLQTFLDEQPIEINNGNAKGSYKWLYEVSYMTTYLEDGQGYKSGQTDPISQNIALKIQLGRYNNSGNDFGILIDHWDAKIVPRKTEN